LQFWITSVDWGVYDGRGVFFVGLLGGGCWSILGEETQGLAYLVECLNDFGNARPNLVFVVEFVGEALYELVGVYGSLGRGAK